MYYTRGCSWGHVAAVHIEQKENFEEEREDTKLQKYKYKINKQSLKSQKSKKEFSE